MVAAADTSAGPLPGSELPAVLGELAATVVPDALKQVATDTDRYRRLITLPDGLLNGMPVELLTAAAVDDEGGKVFPDGVVVAPSASAFVHCRRKQASEPPRSAAIVIGDADEDIQAEADRVAGMLSMPVTVVRNVEELTRDSERFGLLYVASHGFAPSSSTPGAVETDWTIALPGGNLTAEHFYTETIRLARGAVVVLSACSLGRVLPGPAHELLGLINAVFYAGATSVLAARWEVLTEMASLVRRHRRGALHARHSAVCGPAEAAPGRDGRPGDLRVRRGTAGPAVLRRAVRALRRRLGACIF